MSSIKQSCIFSKKIQVYILILLLICILFAGSFPVLKIGNQKAEAHQSEGFFSYEQSLDDILEGRLATIQENTLLPVSEHSSQEERTTRVYTVVTGYSSTIDQTDSTPFLTASGTWVREGVIAANFLPFGTKVKIPAIYGDRLFVVEDRMHPRNHYHVDIWFPSRWEATDFGVKATYIEILEG